MSYERKVLALPVDESQFTTALTVEQLLELVIPGRDFLPRAKVDPLTARRVRDLGSYHDMIQRDLSGQKLANARGELKSYVMNEWVARGGKGVFPPFLIWFPKKLDLRPVPGSPAFEAAIPAGEKSLLMDAESRVEAILFNVEDPNVSPEQVARLLAMRVPVVVFHGLEVALAAKYFADINGKGVRVNPNLLIARDISDPWAQLTLEVFKALGVELESERRQVSPKSTAIITALQARTMVVAVALGVGAVAFGGKHIPEKSISMNKVRKTAEQWLPKVFSKFGADAFKAKDLVLRAVPVLVSLGALGKAFYDGNDAAQRNAYDVLADETIDWHVGARWSGVCGKVNADGNFSVGSGKENAYATYRALTNPDDIGYKRIRGLAPVAVVDGQKDSADVAS